MAMNLQKVIAAEVADVQAASLEMDITGFRSTPITQSIGVGIEVSLVALDYVYDDDDLSAAKFLEDIVKPAIQNNRNSVVQLRRISYMQLLDNLQYVKMLLDKGAR
jgi:hypothetical protein